MVSIKLVSKILKLKLQISKLSLFYLFIFLGKKEVLDLNASLLCSKTSQAENFFLISCFHKVLFCYLLSQRIRFCRSCDHVKLYQSLQMSRKYHTPQQQNLKNYCMTPFLGWGSTVSGLHSCYKETIYFLPLIPAGVPGTRLINLGRIEVKLILELPNDNCLVII